MIRSMLADQPYSLVTRTHGDSSMRWQNDLLDLVSEDVLHELAERLELGLLLLTPLLLILGVVEVETLLGDGLELVVVVVLHLLDHVLVDGVHQVHHLDALLLESLNEGRSGHSGSA